MTRIKTTCDNCKELLRLADARVPLPLDSKFKRLCKQCFNEWLDGGLEE